MPIMLLMLLTSFQGVDAYESRQPRLKTKFLEQGGGSAETEAAVQRALTWLAKEQKADGSWGLPEGGYVTGVTGIALLAFLGSGQTPASPEHGTSIRNGLRYLLSVQDREGCVGERGMKYLLGHAIATAALAEALAMSNAGQDAKPVQKAVDFLISAQNPGKGWRYAAKSGDNDSLVSWWAVSALRAAELAGLRFPKAAYDGARTFFLDAEREDGGFGYVQKGTSEQGLKYLFLEPYWPHESTTAAAALGLFTITRMKDTRRMNRAVEILLKDKPQRDKNQADYFYWHVASRALYSLRGPNGDEWKAWNAALKEVLLAGQALKGEAEGSWESADPWSYDPGRVYSTAINALTLETYYRDAGAFRAVDK